MKPGRGLAVFGKPPLLASTAIVNLARLSQNPPL